MTFLGFGDRWIVSLYLKNDCMIWALQLYLSLKLFYISHQLLLVREFASDLCVHFTFCCFYHFVVCLHWPRCSVYLLPLYTAPSARWSSMRNYRFVRIIACLEGHCSTKPCLYISGLIGDIIKWCYRKLNATRSGAPNVNFRKISVRKTIWDLEF